MCISICIFQAFLEWTVQKASTMSSPPRRRKKSNCISKPSNFSSRIGGLCMTRQFFLDVDDDEENLHSRKKFSPSCSQKPKRRLFLDSSEGEDVEKEDKDKHKENNEKLAKSKTCPCQSIAYSQRAE